MTRCRRFVGPMIGALAGLALALPAGAAPPAFATAPKWRRW